MSARPDFSDLLPRVLSAIVLIVVGVLALRAGGDVWGVLLVIASGLMGWEVSRMHSEKFLVQVVFGLLLAATVLCWLFVSPLWAGILAALLIGVALAAHVAPLAVIGWAAAVGLGCGVLYLLRDGWGIGWTLWLLVVVIASDVGGYFAGKIIGGPKILPKISPKKTWSGTVGGWVLAAAAGAFAWWWGLGGVWMIGLSVPVAMAAQLGDVMESRMKRRAEVKDSSALIPGHGGLLDRFDGVVGASTLMALVLIGWAG